MAGELTKVALWIETVEPGKPLAFLDANIRCGDSLLGIYDLENGFFADFPEDDAHQIAEKRKRFDTALKSPLRWKGVSPPMRT